LRHPVVIWILAGLLPFLGLGVFLGRWNWPGLAGWMFGVGMMYAMGFYRGKPKGKGGSRDE